MMPNNFQFGTSNQHHSRQSHSLNRRERILHAGLVFCIMTMIACTEQIDSVCNGKGTCCGVAYTQSEQGDLKASWFQCVKDCTKCPPENISGSPICPYNEPPKNSCEAKYKLKWAWESSRHLVGQSIDYLNAAYKASKTQVKTISGAVLAKSDPPFCSRACSLTDEDGRVAMCPTVTVPEDVSWGLLSLTTEVAANPNTAKRVYKMADITKMFRVKERETSCKRNDVIVDNGLLHNQGTLCDAGVGVEGTGRHIAAGLQTPQDLLADVITTPGIATFPSKERSFRLSFEKPKIEERFGGPLADASKARSTDIAVGVEGGQGKVCAALTPSSIQQAGFHSAVRVANSRPQSILEGIAELKLIAAKSQSTLDQVEPTAAGRVTARTLLPTTYQYRDYVAHQPPEEASRLKAKAFFGGGSVKGESLSLDQVALIIDAHQCATALDGRSIDERAAFLPELDTHKVDYDSAEVVFRRELAGALVLCTYAIDEVSPAVRNMINAQIGYH